MRIRAPEAIAARSISSENAIRRRVLSSGSSPSGGRTSSPIGRSSEISFRTISADRGSLRLIGFAYPGLAGCSVEQVTDHFVTPAIYERCLDAGLHVLVFDD